MKAKPAAPATESLRKQIEVRAYLLWESAGRPHGRHDEHWAQAEKDILGEQKSKTPPKKKAKAAPAPKPPAKPEAKPTARRSAKPKKK